MTGHSLHIGLNHVDPNAYDGWDGALSGCINDADAMRQIAASQGFTTSRLIDDRATSQAVIGELGRLARTAVAGDLCVVTFSGHGGQVDDSNGDEADVQDETWVLWDRQVVDDELYQMWSQFAAGVRILLISDSCHSGTVAKMRLARRTRDTLAEQTEGARPGPDEVQVIAGTPKNLPVDVQDRDNDRRRGTYQFVQALSGAKSGADIYAELILISGCQDNQLSFDGTVNGQFTGTLLNVWDDGAFDGGHAEFHREILDRMPPDQSPNLFTLGRVSQQFLPQRPFTPAPSTPGTGSGGSGSTGSTPDPHPILKRGASGERVTYLQQRLNAHGAQVAVDGSFGPGTEWAVHDFQATHGLVPDGVVGPATWAQLEAAPAGTDVGGGAGTTGGTTGSGGERPTIQRGDVGEHVDHLQRRLVHHGWRVEVDGVFGPRTESLVRSFQRSNGLDADGIVGRRTWELLG